MNKTSNIIGKADSRGYGKVTLVGFGPGDPDLITVKGLKALENADAIFYDDLTNEEFLRRFEAEKVYVGKRSGKHSAEQDELNQRLYERAAKGDNVVRLKGGDPMLFAHGREEEGAFFYMTREDRDFAIQYYYDGLIRKHGIPYAEYRRTLDYFLFYEYCEWVMLGNRYDNRSDERYGYYRRLAEELAAKLVQQENAPVIQAK